MAMSILLVQHAKENQESYPIGLGYVAGVLVKEGYQVGFLDLAFASDPVNGLARAIQNFKPQALGFTLLTSQYDEFVSIMCQCEKARELKVVVGGPHASADSESILRDDLVNIVVRGEGEVVAPKIFHALEHGDDLSKIKGIAYLDGHRKYIQTEDADYAEDLNCIPWPPYDLFDLHRYRGTVHGIPAVNVMTSRGCPHKCTFCYRGPSGGKKVRFITPQRVVQEIAVLYDDYGFRAVHFRDDIFTLRRSRIMELCEMMIASDRKIFWSCQTRVDCVDYELLSRMKKAGCVSICFGVESGSQEIINKLGKGISKKQVIEAFVNCQKLRIATVAFFMLGTPWETEETIRETIDFAKNLKSTTSAFLCATPYPGTRLREIFIEKGLHVPEDYREYRQFVEGDYGSSRGTDHSRIKQNYVREKCIAATKEIIRAQILDIFSYPRLIREFVNMYGLTRVFRNVLKRLYVLITKS